MSIPIEKFEPPTQAQLEAKARDFLRENKPKLFKQLTKKELQEMCEDKTKSAMDYARRLGGGPDAWNRAIRLEILESETD
jgi:hypothetical protein